MSEFYQTFKEIISILKLFQKWTLPQSYHEASIPLIQKPNKDTIRKENYKPIYLWQT